MVIKTNFEATKHENMMETCMNARLLVILVFLAIHRLFRLFTSVYGFAWEIIHPQYLQTLNYTQSCVPGAINLIPQC